MNTLISIILYLGCKWFETKIQANPYCLFKGCVKALFIMKNMISLFMYGSFINNREFLKLYHAQLLTYIQLVFVAFLFIVMEVTYINLLVLLFSLTSLMTSKMRILHKFCSMFVYTCLFAYFNNETQYSMDGVFLLSFVYVLVVPWCLSSNDKKVFSVILTLIYFYLTYESSFTSQNAIINEVKLLTSKSDFYTHFLFGFHKK